MNSVDWWTSLRMHKVLKYEEILVNILYASLAFPLYNVFKMYCEWHTYVCIYEAFSAIYWRLTFTSQSRTILWSSEHYSETHMSCSEVYCFWGVLCEALPAFTYCLGHCSGQYGHSKQVAESRNNTAIDSNGDNPGFRFPPLSQVVIIHYWAWFQVSTSEPGLNPQVSLLSDSTSESVVK